MKDLPPGEYVVVGGDIDRVTVSLRVVGDDVDPHQVSEMLGVQPTFAARKGDRRLEAGREIIQRTGVWGFGFGGAPEEWTLADAISALIDRLPADLSVWGRLASSHRLDVFCGLQIGAWNQGFGLPPELLLRLAERRLELSVDVYCVPSDEG